MNPKTAGLLILLWLAAGCPAAPTWHSTPASRILEKPDFTVSLTPLAAENGFYIGFALAIENHGATPLSIDWNQSRYLYNGRANGRLVYRGIDLTKLQTAALPLDTIAPGDVYQKEIAPARLLARGPIRDKASQQGWHGITPGFLPAGENGVVLVLLQDSGLDRFKLTLKLAERRAD
jgi:hypothetical protein